MRKTSINVSIIITLFSLSFFGFHQKKWEQEQAAKTQIALLGVFHFAGSTEDVAAIRLDDPLGSTRQKEIKELVQVLAEYRPTKVLVEYPKVNNKDLNQSLIKYLDGDFELTTSETFQVGFRLVEEMGQDRIFAIDHKMKLPMEKVAQFCQRTNQMAAFGQFIASIKSLMEGETTRLRSMTISDYLARMNTNEMDVMANEVYLRDLMSFGDSLSQPGVEVAAEWWKRNMLICQNITETIDRDDERLLVIIGSAHRAVIKQLIHSRSDLEYYEIGELLAN